MSDIETRLAEAEALLRNHAGVFRFYEQQHVEKYHKEGVSAEDFEKARAKASRNAELASVAEQFLGIAPAAPIPDEPPYSVLAMRTEASTFFAPQDKREVEILTDMSTFIDLAARLSRHKSLLFYGKDKPEPETHSFNVVTTDFRNIHDKARLHALLGIASEAGELLEALFKEMRGVDSQSEQEDIDANYSEESGDIDWYQEQLAKSICIPVEQSRRDNIAKLRVRYPDKFTVEAAIARADKPDEDNDVHPADDPDNKTGFASYNDTIS